MDMNVFWFGVIIFCAVSLIVSIAFAINDSEWLHNRSLAALAKKQEEQRAKKQEERRKAQILS